MTTTKLKSFCLLLTVVAFMGLYLCQLDFIVACLNNDISLNVYIEQPKSFVEGGESII